MTEQGIGDQSPPQKHEVARKLSHAPGSPRRQVTYGKVCCVQIGAASSIHVQVGRADWILSIAGTFTLTAKDRLFTIDPNGRPGMYHGDLAPLLFLIGAQAYAPVWDRTGHVVLEFDAPISIRCAPDPKKSAWEIVGPHGQTWSCRPGGQVIRNQKRPVSGGWQRF